MKIKKLLSMALAAAMALSLAAPAAAAKPAKNDKTAVSSESTITLKGKQSGTEFEYDKECWSTWKNVIFLGGANGNSTDEEVSAWHLVYTDKKGVNNDLKSMKLTFDNGEVYEWSWNVGLSTNGSGNNPGWMVVAPASYGKIDVAKSFIVTTSSKNVQFNISGYYEAGSKPAEPDEPVEPDDGKVSAVFQITKYLNEHGVPGAGFVFDIISAETGETVGSMTSDKDGLAVIDLSVAPGKYIIREQVDADEYMPMSDIVVIVDENGAKFEDETFDGIITNVQWGKLEYTTPKVTEKYNELWHTPVYEEIKYDESQTMVSNKILTDDYSEKGIEYFGFDGIKNEFTYMKINKDVLAQQPDGVNVAVSMKKHDVPVLAPVKPWEDPEFANYNIKIVGDELIVTSNLVPFRVRMTTEKPTQQNLFTGTHEGTTYEPKAYDLPILTDGTVAKTFYLGVHYACMGYTSAHILDCDGENLIERECMRPYTGTVTVTVTDEAGKAVTDLTKMVPGEYTVTVTANGQTLDTQTVTVDPGKTTTVTFPGNLTVQGTDEYHCANPDCDLNKSSVEKR